MLGKTFVLMPVVIKDQQVQPRSSVAESRPKAGVSSVNLTASIERAECLPLWWFEYEWTP